MSEAFECGSRTVKWEMRKEYISLTIKTQRHKKASIELYSTFVTWYHSGGTSKINEIATGLLRNAR